MRRGVCAKKKKPSALALPRPGALPAHGRVSSPDARHAPARPLRTPGARFDSRRGSGSGSGGGFGAGAGSRGRWGRGRARLFARSIRRLVSRAVAMGLLPTHHKPSQDLHGNTGGGAASASGKVPGITAALFYGFMSIAAVFLNKAIFEVWKYRYPASLVAGQTVFTVVAIACLSQLGAIKIGAFNPTHFKRVFVVSAVFQLKLVLDMSALVLVNIPMYGILKSATTPFVMLLDFVIRRRVPTGRVQAAVWLTTTGGLVAGYGDLAFDPLGYALALSSAACTACYVVLVGKIGDELQLDSFTLLLYNSLWSTPLSAAIAVLTGEVAGVATFPHLYELPFVVAFLTSCASAFVLNYATYLCTRLNDALTTSVVGRTKSVVQGVGGLFAFSVEAGLVNVGGLTLNSMGILWYAYERYADERRRRGIGGAHAAGLRKLNAREGGDATAHFMSRNESQLTLSPKVVDSNGRALVQQNGGFGAGTHARHPNRGGEVDGGGGGGNGVLGSSSTFYSFRDADADGVSSRSLINGVLLVAAAGSSLNGRTAHRASYPRDPRSPPSQSPGARALRPPLSPGARALRPPPLPPRAVPLGACAAPAAPSSAGATRGTRRPKPSPRRTTSSASRRASRGASRASEARRRSPDARARDRRDRRVRPRGPSARRLPRSPRRRLRLAGRLRSLRRPRVLLSPEPPRRGGFARAGGSPAPRTRRR